MTETGKACWRQADPGMLDLWDAIPCRYGNGGGGTGLTEERAS